MRRWLRRWLLDIRGLETIKVREGDVVVVRTDLRPDQAGKYGEEIAPWFRGALVWVLPKGWLVEQYARELMEPPMAALREQREKALHDLCDRHYQDSGKIAARIVLPPGWVASLRERESHIGRYTGPRRAVFCTSGTCADLEESAQCVAPTVDADRVPEKFPVKQGA